MACRDRWAGTCSVQPAPRHVTPAGHVNHGFTINLLHGLLLCFTLYSHSYGTIKRMYCTAKCVMALNEKVLVSIFRVNGYSV